MKLSKTMHIFFAIALLIITITNTYNLLLNQQWYMSKNMLKLTMTNQSKSMMGLIRTPKTINTFELI